MMEIHGFLDERSCAAIVATLRSGAAAPAPVYGSSAGGAVDLRTRRVSRIEAPDAVADPLFATLMARKDEIGTRFGRALTSCEPLQFLHYREGDFFVAHQDGNTPLIRDSSSGRKVSVVVFLNDPAEYEGGSLVLHREQRIPVRAPAGTLVAFPSETTHEVTPLSRGERFTAVTWYR